VVRQYPSRWAVRQIGKSFDALVKKARALNLLEERWNGKASTPRHRSPGIISKIPTRRPRDLPSTSHELVEPLVNEGYGQVSQGQSG
jgi:hypothetical protein